MCIMNIKERVKQTYIGNLLLVMWQWYKKESSVFFSSYRNMADIYD